MSKSFYEDGELPDDIAAQFDADEKPKRRLKNAENIAALYYRTGWGVIALLFAVNVVLIYILLTPESPLTAYYSTHIAQPTITPDPFLERLPACATILAPVSGYLVISSKMPDYIGLPYVDSDLLRMDLPNKSLCRLTNNMTDDYSPMILPDGQTIIFIARDSTGYWLSEITINSRLISTIYKPAENMDLSPDGRQVVFTDGASVWIENLDRQVNRNSFKRLVRGDSDTWRNFNPAWSPDGSRIAFVSDKSATPRNYGNREEIFLISADGGALHRLTFNNTLDFSPVWLSVSQIAFLGSGDNNTTQIFMLDVNHGELTQLTHDRVFKSDLAFSPVDNGIYYVGSGAIYRVNVDGTNSVQFTEDIYATSLDVWMPKSQE